MKKQRTIKDKNTTQENIEQYRKLQQKKTIRGKLKENITTQTHKGGY